MSEITASRKYVKWTAYERTRVAEKFVELKLSTKTLTDIAHGLLTAQQCLSPNLHRKSFSNTELKSWKLVFTSQQPKSHVEPEAAKSPDPEVPAAADEPTHKVTPPVVRRSHNFRIPHTDEVVSGSTLIEVYLKYKALEKDLSYLGVKITEADIEILRLQEALKLQSPQQKPTTMVVRGVLVEVDGQLYQTVEHGLKFVPAQPVEPKATVEGDVPTEKPSKKFEKRLAFVIVGLHSKHHVLITSTFKSFDFDFVDPGKVTQREIRTKCSGKNVIVFPRGVNTQTLTYLRNIVSSLAEVSGLTSLGAHLSNHL